MIECLYITLRSITLISDGDSLTSEAENIIEPMAMDALNSSQFQIKQNSSQTPSIQSESIKIMTRC